MKKLNTKDTKVPRRLAAGVAFVCVVPFLLALLSCSQKAEPGTLVMIIESSPANLDPRVGTDAQSERIDELVFDALLTRDSHFNVQPGLAESWELRDPKTYVFHLRSGVRFQDGRPLTSRDVKWTFDSILNGTVKTAKATAYRFVEGVEAPDERTVVFHMKEPDAMLPWNVSEGASGIVPYGSGTEFNRKPVGSGPFRVVSQEQDREVVLERNDEYWGVKPKIARVRMPVVPDPTTRALELRKGSADAAINALSPDTDMAIEREHSVVLERAPGTIYGYIAFNLTDPILRDVRVRQALAYAIDREPMIHYLWHDLVRPAASPLPPEHWAYDADVEHYMHDPARARSILDAAGYKAVNGVRFHITMKTSTVDESTRLLAAVLQQQLREVGIALDIRSFEFATFYADVVKGAFQMYSLRWVGGNESADFFDVFASQNVPPRGANRGHYSNPKMDALIAEGRRETDEARRREIYAQVQQILAEDLPYINLWYFDNVLVHSRRVKNVELSPSGDYNFLKTAELQ